jgi:N-acetylmuramoyl-L-alanine amidase
MGMSNNSVHRRFKIRLQALIAALLVTLAVLSVGDPARAGCLPKDCIIVVDAGHGPKVPGATSATGVAEYTFNTRLAGQVVSALVAAGFTRAALLDPKGQDLPPAARARRAGDAKADLLISIHHDSAQPQFMETWTVAGQTRRYSDRFAGYSLFYSGKSAKAAASLELARLIGGELRAVGLGFTRHHAADIPGERRELVDDTVGVYRYDGLAVLREADMPAVLLEAGVIINRTEEIELAGAKRQQRIAEAVAKATLAWCAGKKP